MSSLDQILSSVLSTVKGLSGRPNVESPSPEELEKRTHRFGRATTLENYSFQSVVKNRSAGLTVYVGSQKVAQEDLNPRQKAILESVPETVKSVEAYVKKAPLLRTIRRMGQNAELSPLCELFVSRQRPEVIRLAHFFNLALFEPDGEAGGPHLWLVDLPEWQEKDRQILVFPEVGVTYVLGSDYYGEVKKGFLRMGMWHAKQRGMLGVHAGSKILRARDESQLRRYSMFIFGLTATGKTTHTCHTHGLDGDGEGIEIAQDDVVFLKRDFSALGTERGFFLKTEGLAPDTQPLIYRAVVQTDAVFENVMVDHRGVVDFDDLTLTGNGRGVMQRAAFGDYMGPVNIPPAQEIDGAILAFITRRNTVMPMAAKLTTAQAAAAFMLGESIESSGGDPRKAGMSVREVGTNPFIIGSKAEEGNRFYDFMKSNGKRAQGYLLNTGGVGEVVKVLEDGRRSVQRKVKRIAIPEMASIIRGIARGMMTWRKDAFWDLLTPAEVPGVDYSKFDPQSFYPKEEILKMVETLREERREYLEGFEGLDPDIVKAGGF